MENPFAGFGDQDSAASTRTARRGWSTSRRSKKGDSLADAERMSVGGVLRKLLVVGSLFAGLTVGASYLPTLMVARITSDFDPTDGPQRRSAMLRLAAWGEPGCSALLNYVRHPDDAVADDAIDLLAQVQLGWADDPEERRRERHRQWVDRLTAMATQIPTRRHEKVRGLLAEAERQLGSSDDSADPQWMASIRTLRSVLQPARVASQQQVTNDDALASSQLVRVDRGSPAVLAARRISVDPPTDQRNFGDGIDRIVGPSHRSANDELNDASIVWPSDEQVSEVESVMVESMAGTGVSVEEANVNRLRMDPPKDSSAAERGGTPAGLVRLDETEMVASSPMAMAVPERSNPRSAAVEIANTTPPPPSHLPLAHELPPMRALSDVSVFDYLHGSHPEFRQAAELELRDRGFDDVQLAAARELASPRASDRIAAMQWIAKTGSLDARLWIGRMLGDADRDVRLSAITMIASMNDAQSRGMLRLQLARESDPVVLARLRRYLKLR